MHSLKVAARIKSLLHSETYQSKCYISNKPDRKVQDPYTLRCIPQVHGVVLDTVHFSNKSNFLIFVSWFLIFAQAIFLLSNNYWNE